MEKYLIAIIRPNLTFCMNDADELKVRLADEGIHAKWFRNGDYVYVETSHGTIEFMPSTVLDNERTIKSHVAGKRYTKLFGVLYIPEELRGYVKSGASLGNYISFIIEKEMEYLIFAGKSCETCKNFPICSIKEEYAKMQVDIDALVDGSEHFRTAKLECKYYISSEPMFPCGHV